METLISGHTQDASTVLLLMAVEEVTRCVCEKKEEETLKII